MEAFKRDTITVNMAASGHDCARNLLLISSSSSARSLVKRIVGRLRCNAAFADSLRAAWESGQTGAGERDSPLWVTLVDADVEDVAAPGARDELAEALGDAVVLALVPESWTEEEFPPLGGLHVHDVLRMPLVASELERRLDAAFVHARERRWRRFFERVAARTAAGLIALDGALRVRWLNERAEALLAYEPGELLDRPLSFLAPGPDAEAAADESPGFAEILALPRTRDVATVKLVRGDGRPLWVRCEVRDFTFLGRSATLLTFWDVTEEEQRLSELMLSARVLECTGEAVLVTDRGDRILSVNRAFTVATGYEPEEVIGRRPDFLSSGRQDAAFYAAMWEKVHREGHWKGEVWNRRKNGEVYPEWMAVSAVKDPAGNIDHYVTILSDITDRLAEQENLRHLAQHDFLTGLPNRVLLEDRFQQAVASAARRKRKVAVLFLDLDAFKAVNDEHGHYVGDLVLQAVAERLTASVRATDTVTRYGGDEFVLLLPEVDAPQTAEKLASKIAVSFHRPFQVEGHELTLSASIGTRLYPDHGTELRGLVAGADAAMYENKSSKRVF